MLNDISMGIYDDWSYRNSASVSIQWAIKIYSVNRLVISNETPELDEIESSHWFDDLIEAGIGYNIMIWQQ